MLDNTQPWPVAASPSGGVVLAGRYRLSSLIGRGGMAEVYLARDGVLERTVAVKVSRGGTRSQTERDRQQHEVWVLGQLSHPGLVTVFDAGTEPGGDRSYLVMELVSGPTLARRIADGPMEEQQVRAVGRRLAEALAYVHARGFVHRDVKPGNVLFVDDSPGCTDVKLADFGIARFSDSGHLTDTGLTVGSAHYLSPEQARGVEVEAPTDVYSLGLVLIEALTGQRSFPGAGLEAAVARLQHDPEVPSGLDPAFRRLLEAMTSAHPAERPSAAYVASELAAAPAAARTAAASSRIPAEAPTTLLARSRTRALPRLGVPAGTTAVSAEDAPRATDNRSRRWVVLSAGAGLVVAAAVALFGVLAPADPRSPDGSGRPGTGSSASLSTSPTPATPVVQTPVPEASIAPAAQPAAPAPVVVPQQPAGGAVVPLPQQNGKQNKDKGKGKNH